MDCYLCGAHNSGDADFCERCNGQLLRIGNEPAPEADELHAPAPQPEPAPEAPSSSRQESLQSVEHRRLSAALGLGDQPSKPPPTPRRPAPVEEQGDGTAVTAVPTATAASGIPLIGTRAASFETKTVRDGDPGRKTAVALVVLSLLVGWFGYRTVTNEPVEVVPEQLAFASTTTRPSTTTTEPPPRVWTENEVLGKFSSVFVTVELSECPVEIVTGKEDVVDDWRTPGVLIDEHNVVFDGSELQSAAIAVVRSRIGSETVGRVSADRSGFGVVTSAAPSNRNVKLVDEPMGDPMYWVTRDSETGGIVVSTDPISSDGEAVILVTSQGDPLSIQIGSRTAELDDLQTVAIQETTVVSDLSLGSSLCAEAPTYVDSVVAATLVEEED